MQNSPLPLFRKKAWDWCFVLEMLGSQQLLSLTGSYSFLLRRVLLGDIETPGMHELKVEGDLEESALPDPRRRRMLAFRVCLTAKLSESSRVV